MEVVVTTGAIRRAKLQSNHHHQQTNIQYFYRPGALPVTQPTVSKRWREAILQFCPVYLRLICKRLPLPSQPQLILIYQPMKPKHFNIRTWPDPVFIPVINSLNLPVLDGRGNCCSPSRRRNRILDRCWASSNERDKWSESSMRSEEGFQSSSDAGDHGDKVGSEGSSTRSTGLTLRSLYSRRLLRFCSNETPVHVQKRPVVPGSVFFSFEFYFSCSFSFSYSFGGTFVLVLTFLYVGGVA